MSVNKMLHRNLIGIPFAEQKRISADSFVDKQEIVFKQEQGSEKKTHILLPP